MRTKDEVVAERVRDINEKIVLKWERIAKARKGISVLLNPNEIQLTVLRK